jgi:hypothetical protein
MNISFQDGLQIFLEIVYEVQIWVNGYKCGDSMKLFDRVNIDHL